MHRPTIFAERSALERTIQVTSLVDTPEYATLFHHCSTNWPAETRIVPKVNLQNAGDHLRLAANKGYDDMNIHEALRAVGVRLLIKHCVFAPYTHALNARIDDDLYLHRKWRQSHRA